MFEAGQVVGDRYRLEGRLGDNESRQTWLAKDLGSNESNESSESGDKSGDKSGELVVLKLLALNGLTQWNDVKFLEREADTLRSLDHPQLPKFRDYVSLPDHHGWFALVMDYIPGVSLKQKLKSRHRFEVEEIEAIARSVLKILDYLHHHRPPILHRDIKPSNLIAGDDDQIYLIEFGAVQNQPRLMGSTFTVAGTYGYTPIEQYGGQTSPASDLYAFGATLVHLLTGIAPMDLPQHHFRLQFRNHLPKELSQGWVEWLENLTAPDVGDRYQSVTTALNELLILRRDRVRGNETPRSPQTGALSFATGGSDDTAIAPENGISIYESDRLTVEIPSKFKVQIIDGGRSLFRDAFVGNASQPSLLRKEWLAVKGSSLFTIILLVGIFGLITSPYAFIRAILGIVALLIQILVSVVPFLITVSVLLSMIYGRGYFNGTSLLLSNTRFTLEIKGLEAHTIQGFLHQIQSCEVVRLDLHNDKRHGLAIAIRPGRWTLNARPKVYLVGQALPLEELEKTARRIQNWLKTHDPQLSRNHGRPTDDLPSADR